MENLIHSLESCNNGRDNEEMRTTDKNTIYSLFLWVSIDLLYTSEKNLQIKQLTCCMETKPCNSLVVCLKKIESNSMKIKLRCCLYGGCGRSNPKQVYMHSNQ